MLDPMRATVTEHSQATVVALSGELDADTAGRLRTLLAEQLLAGPSPLVLDLTELTFIDSAGLAALISGSKGARRAGVELILAGPAAAVRKVMKLTGIDVILTTVDDVEQALARLEPPV